MTDIIKPFSGLRVKAEFADQTIAPPYDVINSKDAKTFAEDKPWSFLHLSKPEIDSVNASDDIYKLGKENLQRFKQADIFIQDSPCYYVHQMQFDGHVQTGFVVAASLEAYRQDKIRKHERTRPDKERDRVNLLAAQQAQINPLLLSYRHQNELAEILKQQTRQQTVFDGTLNSVRHQYWKIDDEEVISHITALFNKLGVLYVADGHHRAAAAARYVEENSFALDDPAQYFLAELFPDNELNILGYHRIVKGLAGLSAQEFMAALRENFDITTSVNPVLPEKNINFGMYLNGHWHILTCKQFEKDSLPVSILNELIIEPLLKITDHRGDPRVEYIGGVDSPERIQQRIDIGDMTVGFTLFPTSMEQIIQVADKGQVVPPKYTWFEPKLADGFVIYDFKA